MQARSRWGATLLFLAVVSAFLVSRGSYRAAADDDVGEQRLWAGYWTVQPGFTSTLEMKNNRIGETVTAHVSLYFASGEEYPLAPLVLGPRQVAVIDLNRAVESLPQSVAARASKEGTIEVAFDAVNASAVMASVSVRNPERGIAWNFFLRPTGYWPQPNPTPLQSVFWFHDSEADGFVALQNVSEGTVTVTPRFHVAGAVHEGTPVALLAGQGHKLELRRELQRLSLNQTTAGGIELAYQGAAGAVLAHGVLFDGHGFSAEMDFLPHEAWEEKTDFFYRAPRVALGPVDPALGLPAPTLFKPTMALHNFNIHPLNVTLAFGPSGGATPQPTAVLLTLAAGETRVVDLYTLLQGSGAAGPWANLELSYSDWHTNLGMMLSVSENGEHSIRSVLNWVEAATREGWYWQADANTNTLLGIQNSDTEAATVRVALDYYAEGTRHSYELPDLSIAGRGSALVNIGEIVSGGIADADGDVIPLGVTFGGYRTHKVGPNLVNITTEALIVDRQRKTFLSMYNTGCCEEPMVVVPTSITGLVGTIAQLAVRARDTCTGDFNYYTEQAFKTSSNNSVATVDSTGGVSLVGAGMATITATWAHYLAQPSRCIRKSESPQCSVTSKPRIDSITPGRGPIDAATMVTIQGRGFVDGSTTVSAGSGITVTLNSVSETRIVATFNVSATAPVGNHSVTATTSGLISNSVNFFVATTFAVAYSSYIPVDHISGPSYCNFAGAPILPIYMGDANRNTYRTTESIQVSPDTQQSSSFFQDTGQTRNYGYGSPTNGSTLSSGDEDGVPSDCYLWNAAGKATPAFSYDVSYPYAHQAQVHYSGSAANPLESPLATIEWDMRTVLDTTNAQSPTGYVNYNHTCYPAHQMIVNGQVIYLYTPPRNDVDYLFDCLFLHINKVSGETSPTTVPRQ